MEKTFNDLTIKQVMQFQGIDTSTLSGQKQLCEIIFGVDPETLPLDEFLEMIGSLPEFFGKLHKTFKPEITLSGKVFKAQRMEDMQTKEFIDFDTLSEKSNEQAPMLLALIYAQEELDKLEYPENVKAKAKILEDMPAGEALGALDFFTRKLLRYVRNIADSSDKAKELMKNPKMKEAMETMGKFLSEDGDGI